MSSQPAKIDTLDLDEVTDLKSEKLLSGEAATAKSRAKQFLDEATGRMLGTRDETLVRSIKEEWRGLAATMSAEKRLDFYTRLADAFSTFFGLDQADQEIIAQDLRDLLAKVFPELALITAQIDTYQGSTSIAALKSSIHEEIHRLREGIQRGNAGGTETSLQLDINQLVAQLFGAEENTDPSNLLTKLDGITPVPPDEVLVPLRTALRSFQSKGKTAHRKAVLSILKGARKKTLEHASESDPLIAGLEDLLAFIHTLETRRVTLSDLHLVEYLSGQVSEEEAVTLIGVDPKTLPGAILKSKYNGDRLQDDRFIAQASNGALLRDVAKSITAVDFANIARCLTKIATGELKIDEICLRTGIGASTQPVPMRILAYALPVLTIARRFQANFGASPQVELFTGEEGGIGCNGMDPDVVKNNTGKAFRIIKDFVEAFYPDVKDSFALADDKEWSDPKIQLLINYLENILLAEAETNEELGKIVKELKKRGTVYGGENGAENAVKYAAFHVICFRDVPTIDAYLGDRDHSGRHVISFGGASEAAFDFIRDILVARFTVEDFNQFASDSGREELRINHDLPALDTRSTVIANTGVIPPYFLVPESGDISLDDLDGLGADGVRALIVERLHRALQISTEPTDRPARTLSGASSLMQGVSMISAAVGSERLIQFLLSQTDVRS